MRRIAIYKQPINRRSSIVCDAMLAGLKKLGESVEMLPSQQYVYPQHDVAIFYGLHARLAGLMKDYSADPKRKAIYIDLGYFGRRDGGKLVGFHKIVVDARHPTAYFQSRRHNNLRARRFNVRVRPWRANTHDGPIILAGMGPKGAGAEGLAPHLWETQAATKIRRVTNRRIVYRPKPNWEQATNVHGCEFTRPNSIELLEQIAGAHAVVSHHSNANVEAILYGIPSFCVDGVATLMGETDLAKIESPLMPDGREQWLNDLAYTQWSVAEMAEGHPWRHLLSEGLVP